MPTPKRIFVAGHKGMVGSAICRALAQQPNVELVIADRTALDLMNQSQVAEFFADTSINEVYFAAAKVGGIHANNTYPAEFIHENLVMQSNVIHSAHCAGVDRLLFLGNAFSIYT